MDRRTEQILKEAQEQLKKYSYFNGYKYKGFKSICSTCKFFDGECCKKGFSFAGFAMKLSECNDEWEVCNGIK